MKVQPINPETLGAPHGYSHGSLGPAGGRMLCVAGQIGWDKNEVLVSEAFVPQFEQALRNILEVIKAAGGGPEDLARLTIYVTDRLPYLGNLREVGRVYRAVMGYNFPAMALVEVAGLLHPQSLVEIEATAILPPEG